jgi:hypothetical protein
MEVSTPPQLQYILDISACYKSTADIQDFRQLMLAR